MLVFSVNWVFSKSFFVRFSDDFLSLFRLFRALV